MRDPRYRRPFFAGFLTAHGDAFDSAVSAQARTEADALRDGADDRTCPGLAAPDAVGTLRRGLNGGLRSGHEPT
jgi:hypothetical protein